MHESRHVDAGHDQATPQGVRLLQGGATDRRNEPTLHAEGTSTIVRDFIQNAVAMRVVFGNGAALRLADEVEALGIRTPTVVTTPSLRERAVAMMAPTDDLVDARTITVSTDTATDNGIDVEKVLATIGQADPDIADCGRRHAPGGIGIVAIGGGTAVSVARRAAHMAGVPLIAVPTTYASREASLEPGRHNSAELDTARSKWALLPETVIYDPSLTNSLPPHLTAVSAMAAISRAAKVLWSGAASPLIELEAEEAISCLADAVQDAVLDPKSVVGRSRLLYGAHLVATVMERTPNETKEFLEVDGALALAAGVHRSDIEAALLPARLAAVTSIRPLAVSSVARALGSNDAVAGARELAFDLGVPGSLAGLNLSSARLTAVREAVQHLSMSETDRRAVDTALSDAVERNPR